MRKTNSIVGFRRLSIVGTAAILLMTTGCGFVSAREYPTSTPSPTYSDDSSSSGNDGSSGNGVDVIIIDPSKPYPTTSPSSSTADGAEQTIAIDYQELLQSMYSMDTPAYDAYMLLGEEYPGAVDDDDVAILNSKILEILPWLKIVNTDGLRDKEINFTYTSLASQAYREYELRESGVYSDAFVTVPQSAVTLKDNSTAVVDHLQVEVSQDNVRSLDSLGEIVDVTFVNVNNEWLLNFEEML